MFKKSVIALLGSSSQGKYNNKKKKVPYMREMRERVQTFTQEN
jgi:hypothetical protein